MSTVDFGQRRSSIRVRDVVLVVEARHRVVGLRLEPRAGDAPAWRSGSNTGKRPPRVRPWTSAVMNTVLPARDRPVTPSRTVGLKKLSP